MGYINQSPSLHTLFADLDARLRLLETAVRFTAPPVDFLNDEPTNPRMGDMYYDINSEYIVYWNGTVWWKLSQTLL